MTADYLRTLFLNPPSYGGFDGGAGSRYQARREIRSFWYPTWLAYPAGMIPGSRLIDAPPANMDIDDVVREAGGYEVNSIMRSRRWPAAFRSRKCTAWSTARTVRCTSHPSAR